MTLGRRALLLIFPVVLASYVLVALTVYIAQSSALMRLEQARLSQQVNTLQSLFHSQLTFNHGYIHSLLRDNAIRQFLSESNPGYRSNALGARLQESIQSLMDDPRRFMSVAVFRPKTRDVDFYFENSDDPFADITSEQRLYAAMLKPGGHEHSWHYLALRDSEPLIVHSEFLDAKTLSTPLPSQVGKAYLVQVAIRAHEFSALKARLEKEYGAPLEIAPLPLPANGRVAAAAELGPGLHIRLVASDAYLESQLLPLKLTLGGAGLALGIATLLLLLFLVRRYIIGPVASLDRQVTEVMAGQRERIAGIGGSGELARLSSNMTLMYDNLNHSLARIRGMNWTDPLTLISNRTHFNLRGSELLAASTPDSRYSMLFIDLDNFKFVNDRYGHESGDALLATFAGQLRGLVSDFCRSKKIPRGLLARLSGDEFAILIKVDGGSDLDSELACWIIAIFTNGFPVGNLSYPVSASIGIASFPEDADSITHLTSKADMAMYQAKSGGKNRWASYSPELEQKSERERLIQGELRLVKPDEQFSLAFMPIVDGDGRVVRGEALLRWQSPVLGQVSPGEFVPIAESNGLFAKIDHWVIDKAMGSYRQLAAIFGDDFILSINLSAAELHSTEINDRLCDCLKRHDVDASCFEIELTETFAANVSSKISAALVSLRQMGFRIAIDDFGAGYTSIRQIIEYPADTIKLDLHIVHQMTDAGEAAVLASMISLCHARGMKVVAEGIDTEKKRRLLEEAGCDLYQGYLVSKPLGIEDFCLFGLKQVVAVRQVDASAPVGRSA